MALATALLVLGLIDLDHQILPDAITLPGLAAGLVLGVASGPGRESDLWLAVLGGLSVMAMVGLVTGWDRRRPDDAAGPDWKMVAMLAAFALWQRAVLGVASGPALTAAAAYLIMAAVAMAAASYYKQEALGQGDWKMVAMLGAFLGGHGVLLAVFLGTLTAALTGLLLVALKRGSRKTRIPLGTFLALGGLVAIFAGEPILAWYRGIYRG
jgi:prepilin signal peptidase PulO-like enzyme (type II secretory pathway)